MKIEWAEPAELDLGDIYAYIARDVPFMPSSLLTGLLKQ
ncbi:type II toxin-antitoxin system RelE/ParE family toxin [Cellvibrio sp. OA-2007]|nr:type II toxin-antitoxin system RelE/ParE family toxin [Cellvibrio sp. OA-2007]